MLLTIPSICSQEELVESDAESDEAEAAGTTEDLAARRQLIKNKILAVGRMQKVFQLLRFVFLFLFLFLFLFPFFFSLSIEDDSSPFVPSCPESHTFFFPLFCSGDERNGQRLITFL